MVPKKGNQLAIRKVRVRTRVRKVRKSPSRATTMIKYNPINRYNLDRPALDWATLLTDPCNAKLVYPCFPSGNGSTVLMRVEADAVIFASATATAGFGMWIPGVGLALTNNAILNSDTAGALLDTNTLIAPGDAFLKSRCSGFRAVAGCLQIMYPGTELDRSGIVGIGIVDAGMYQRSTAVIAGGNAEVLSAGLVRTSCQHTERMPATLVECKWFPGEADFSSYPGLYPVEYARDFSGHNAIQFSISGMQAASGVRIRTVCVYEVAFSSFNGQVTSVAPPVSTSTTSNVLKFLADKDPQWYLETARKAGNAVSSIVSYARMGYKAAGMAVNGLALLAA